MKSYAGLYRVIPSYTVSYHFMPKNKFLTVKEVADYLVVHERTVYRYIKAKKLKATKIGSWRITVGDIQDFIKRSSNIKK